MKNIKELTIIIPCFNEGKTIVNVINDLINHLFICFSE